MMSYQKIFILLLSALVIIPMAALANGGDQRVIENKYLINLSRAPFTPRVGITTSFLVSFIDIQKNKLISEDLVVRIRISKLGDAPKGKFIFEQDNVAVKGGVLEFSYTFSEAVLHEIFFDFAFASNLEKVYNAPDFLIDVQRQESSKGLSQEAFMGIGVGTVVGFIAGWFVRSIYRRSA